MMDQHSPSILIAVVSSVS